MSGLTYQGDLLNQTDCQSEFISDKASLLITSSPNPDVIREVKKLTMTGLRGLISDSVMIDSVTTYEAKCCVTNINATSSFTLNIPNNSSLVFVKNTKEVDVGNSIILTISGQELTLYPKCSVKIKTSSSGVISYAFDDLIDRIYPIGSYYYNINNTKVVSPQSIYGGTWVQLNGVFLLADGTTNQKFYKVDVDPNVAANSVYFTYAATTTSAGASSVGLGINHLPSHTHNYGNHNHSWYQFYDNGGNPKGGRTDSSRYRRYMKRPYSGQPTGIYYDAFDTNFEYPGQSSYVQNGYDNNNPAGVTYHTNLPLYTTTYCWRRTG